MFSAGLWSVPPKMRTCQSHRVGKLISAGLIQETGSIIETPTQNENCSESSDLIIAKLSMKLSGDKDELFLMQGIEQGFKIVDEGSDNILKSAETDNYSSSLSQKYLVEDQIKTEFLEGRYKVVKDEPSIVSALGAIPNPNNKGLRLIHDCSKPLQLGLNCYAS